MDLFPNAWTVTVREFRLRVNTRVFQIVTLILALIGLGLVLMPVGLSALGLDEPSAVEVYAAVPEAEEGAAALVGTLNGMEQSGAEAETTTDPDAARAAVEDGDLDGLVTVNRAQDDELTFDLYTAQGGTSGLVLSVTAASNQVAIADRLVRAGVDPTQVGEIFAPTAFQVTPVDPNAVDPEAAFGPRYILATAIVILVFMAIITYGQWVATSVAEEKASRVMELLITAANPRQLLLGKVMGAGGAGLVQYVVVLAAAMGGLLLQGTVSRLVLGESAGDALELEGLNLGLLLVVGLFFLGGFALYATLYAALGSTANRQEEVQNLTGPMIIIGVAGYLIAFTALNVPDADWVRILSFVPFFSPYLIPVRMVMGQIAPWEIGLAFLLLIVGAGIALWVAARIYSAGVLLYGQKAGLRNIWRAVRVNR
ncbi:MAG TPA: ABC transporter permease [Candidatus Limnocylindria bacterium]|jgi:ABC-2 type transport system permease protein